MKIGDLIKRKDSDSGINSDLVEKNGKYGLVVSKEVAGNPPHECAIVWWPRSGKVYSIGTYWIEIVSD